MSQSNELVSAERAKNAVVIYHKNCNDGFGAAWAFWKLMDHKYDDVSYHALGYGDPLPTFLNCNADLFILDFSFPRDQLNFLSEAFKRVLLLDHHKTAEADLTGWKDQPFNLTIVFDKTRSGASITWDFFSGLNDPNWNGLRPKLIGFIEDRDLWKFKYEGTKAIHEVLSLKPKSFDQWNRFANRIEQPSGYIDAVHEGELIRVHTLNLCDKIINEGVRPISINGVEGLVCNAPGIFASEIGSILATRHGGYGASYVHLSDGSVKFSLRADGNIDVSEIAKSFGGGGHANSSGFVLKNGVTNSDDSGVVLWNTQEGEGDVITMTLNSET